MSSFFDDGGVMRAPLNVTATAPVLDLNDFDWQAVDEIAPSQFPDGHLNGRVSGQRVLADGPKSEKKESRPTTTPWSQKLKTQFGVETLPKSGADFPLDLFKGTYAGNGFNMIFRPRSTVSKDDVAVKRTPEGKEASQGDNVLEINLTTEQLSFGGGLGSIPNRGLDDQSDITLAGVPYVQTVQDRTNAETGLGDNPDKTDIHFEPGVFLFVPPSEFQGGKAGKASIVRMASIPHGTTINAQGFFPGDKQRTITITGKPGIRPKIDDIDTTPFLIGKPKDGQQSFESMNAGNQKTFRIPQDLEKFNEGKTGTGRITTKIIKNPHFVLQQAVADLEIEDTIAFDISTEPEKSSLLGGGTTNIAFLGGKPEVKSETDLKSATINTPTAQAVSVNATYWIERVLYTVEVPVVKPNGQVILRATMPKGSTAPTPLFKVKVGDSGNPAKKVIKIHGTQIQVSQQVNLNFRKLTWPHVSVSTLVPKSPQLFQMA